MKLKILHFSLLFAATTAKDVYFEDAATDSPAGAEAVVPAAKLGVDEALAANHRRTAQCVDTDYGAVDVDPWNDACTDYIGNTHWCGNYDDDDFTSNTMCCACGGGEDMRVMGKTGEEACENQDLSKSECQNVGCCQWAACPIWGAVGWGRAHEGQCHSAASVQNGQCTSVPWESHYEDGAHCGNSWGWGWG